MYLLRKIFFLLIFYPVGLSAQTLESFKQQTQIQLQQKTQATLAKYCNEGCELISVTIEASQSNIETDELGFEALAKVDMTPQFQVQKVSLHIQIDDRVASKEKLRLQKLLENNARALAPTVEVMWSAIQLPRVGFTDKDEETLKQKVTKDVTQTIHKIIEEYCPGECLLNKVTVDGEQVTPDEAKSLPGSQIIKDANLLSSLYVKNVMIDLTLDNKILKSEKERILDLMRAKLSWIEPVELRTRMLNFPQANDAKKAADPYGLERLKETLKIFREMAGTKEIITNSTTKDSSLQNSQQNTLAKDSLISKETRENSSSHSDTQVSEKNSSEKNASDKKIELYLLAGMGVLVLAAVTALLMRRNKESRELVTANSNSPMTGERQTGVVAYRPENLISETGFAPPPISYREIQIKRQIQNLKDDIAQFFIRQPKISKDVFTRILHEQGQDEAAKYVHVFGAFVLREFMNETKMRQDILRLSETYQKSSFDFTDEQTLKILQNLKARVTASEIRMLVQSDPFEFLKSFDADQIVKLLNGETLLVQGFLLTQLETKVRNEVFAKINNNEKLKIMAELAHVQSIPREFLESLALALKDKIKRLPDLDAEKINGSDVLFELLQQSTFSEQKSLIQELSVKNPQLSEFMRSRLVTSEVIPYLRDGQVLELVMGMNRQYLLHFLLGAPEAIRESILNRCPRDLVNTWIEDIQSRGMNQVEKSDFEFAQSRVHERIQYLIQQGGVNLREINEKIFMQDVFTKNNTSHLRRAS